ncbi:MAG: lysophospholipase [Gemmataceae bacterium]|nr:lysophospholipase [Gemmataceae bacterium]
MAETAPNCTVESFTASDGYVLHYRRYQPEGPPRAQVVVIHGIQSHSGWYGFSCDRLRKAGFVVSFLDRRGSGMNVQERGDAPSFRRLLDDIGEFLLALPPAPLRFLCGISWGGKVVTALQRRRPGLVSGLLLLCPGFFPKVKPSFKQRLRILWSRLAAPRRCFDIPLNDPELFTASPQWQQFIREDPLALRQATARLLIESVRLDGYLKVVPGHVDMPVLLLLAEHDRIIANEPTRRFFERFATKDREIIEYPGAQHTLEFEPNPQQFCDDIQRWLERHLPT